jgi:hypothetical protein
MSGHLHPPAALTSTEYLATLGVPNERVKRKNAVLPENDLLELFV